jgi:hypothetical protein
MNHLSRRHDFVPSRREAGPPPISGSDPSTGISTHVVASDIRLPLRNGQPEISQVRKFLNLRNPAFRYEHHVAWPDLHICGHVPALKHFLQIDFLYFDVLARTAPEKQNLRVLSGRTQTPGDRDRFAQCDIGTQSYLPGLWTSPWARKNGFSKSLISMLVSGSLMMA